MLKTEMGLVRNSPRGLRLDVLVKTENARGCKFFRTQCNHCNMLDVGTGIEPSENQQTLTEAIARLGTIAEQIRQADIYCTGNVLDKDEVSDSTFGFALELFARSLPSIECVGMDGRPEIVLTKTGRNRLERATRVLEGIRIEPIIGYETQDKRLRMSQNGLNKKITDAHMEAVFRLVKELGLGLQINIMLMPVPTMSLKEAVDEAIHSIIYIREMKDRFGITDILVNLHPLFITSRIIAKWGHRVLEVGLPTDKEIEEVIERCKGILPIFIGRYDEGLSIKKAFSDE